MSLASIGLILAARPRTDVFPQLADWVADPARRSGGFVTEAQLSETFGVSRPPLREALRQAQAIGLVLREPNRQIEIPALGVAEMEDLSRTREVLEGLVARLVTARFRAGEVSLEGLEAIERRIAAFARLGDFESQLHEGLRFHARMRELAASPVAGQLLEHVVLRLERYRRLVLPQPERAGMIVEEHAAMLAAIRRHDEAGAAALASAHIAQARPFYLRALEAAGR